MAEGQHEKLDTSSSEEVPTKRHKTVRKENWEQIDLGRLITSNGIRLRLPHRLPPKYAYLTEENSNPYETENVGAEECLEMLLSFLFGENIPTAKAVIDEIFSKSAMILLRELYKNKKFTSDIDPKDDDSANIMHLLNKKLGTVHKLLAEKEPPINSKIEHDNVKDFFTNFAASIILDGFMMNGTCVMPIMVNYPDKNPRPSRIKFTNFGTVNTIPDLLIGSDHDPVAVPLEVYSSHVYQKDTVCAIHWSEPESLDEEDIHLEVFLENLPSFRGPARAVRQFGCKLTVQCLLHLLGCCTAHLDAKHNESERVLSKERRSFIAVFAHRFDVYFLKIETSERELQMGGSKAASQIFGSRKPITLQYFPIPLNMSNPNHAAAFAFFLKYYRNMYQT